MTRQDSALLSYDIEIHQHRFAAWAACRAASVVNCRFGVEQGRAILEACAFTANFCRPEQLPDPEPQAVDDTHRRWRIDIIREAKLHGFLFTHGSRQNLSTSTSRAASSVESTMSTRECRACTRRSIACC